MSDLTARQLQVARLIAKGDTNSEIAERLQISESAVKAHSILICQKLGDPCPTCGQPIPLSGKRRIAAKMRTLGLLDE